MGASNGSPSRNSGGNDKGVSRSIAEKRSPPPKNINRKISSYSSTAKDEKPNGSRRPFPITKHMHFSSQLMSTARCYEYGMKVESC